MICVWNPYGTQDRLGLACVGGGQEESLLEDVVSHANVHILHRLPCLRAGLST